MTLKDLYRHHCTTPSDINEHLPYLLVTVEQLDAQNVIELGTRSGVSTVAWLYGLERTGGHLWSVDLEPAPEIPGVREDEWTHVVGNDLDPAVVNALPDDADVVFIDTSHGYDHTLAELHVYRWRVRAGGRILLHDTQLVRPIGEPAFPKYPVRTAIEEFCREERLSWTDRPNNFGLGTIRIPEA